MRVSLPQFQGPEQDRVPGSRAILPTADHFASRRCGICGSPVTRKRFGRRPVVCSTACRRARQYATRKLRRRQEWMQQWQVYARQGRVDANEAREQVLVLAAEIRALERLGGRP